MTHRLYAVLFIFSVWHPVSATVHHSESLARWFLSFVRFWPQSLGVNPNASQPTPSILHKRKGRRRIETQVSTPLHLSQILHHRRDAALAPWDSPALTT
ncbi:uncharacterized protein SPSK_00351 [Sporothrix schenckii 1099-18]|uniref:Secreted protein n=1 Tax=Sporothrix schenckii 1099-18 TaxID=1397361 RepID=A0A0F2M5D1_SPOSC|nr:uncharacterized protein SPSK_00351 [Sporothrix schenckii 1099-18]KJR83985.1 hypothetical protein SPSK_00351 [Sporothrix schenckii 1099-18]